MCRRFVPEYWNLSFILLITLSLLLLSCTTKSPDQNPTDASTEIATEDVSTNPIDVPVVQDLGSDTETSDTTQSLDQGPPPTPPTWNSDSKINLLSKTPTSLQLSWTEAQDEDGVVAYHLRVDGGDILRTNETEIWVDGLSPETSYTLDVQAEDSLGALSTDGPTLQVSTAPTPLSSETVFERLKPTCMGCHLQGTLPLFYDMESFLGGIVYNADLVVPGAPSESGLLAILKGEPGFVPMPMGNQTFAEMEAADLTQITISELEAWIAHLEPPDLSLIEAPTDHILLRRLRAEHIVTGLFDLLGTSPEDFFDPGSCLGQGPLENFPIISPDAPPGSCETSYVWPLATERFLGLGGPDWARRVARDQSVSNLFFQTLVPMVQAHCRLGITKNSDNVLMVEASLTHNTTQHPTVIRNNIAYMHLRLVGEEASDDQLKELFDLFVEIEGLTPADDAWGEISAATAAWTAICSTLLRSPLGITY
ncbi:MAG: hypothetical protein CMH54_05575 [Myxococcales bacterium]|nr:hypothetical protein [Myxococcales bacterium]